MKLKKEFDKIFGAEDGASIPAHYTKQLLRMAWSGSMCPSPLRAFCWRVLLGLLSSTDKSLWQQQLSAVITDYFTLKQRVMPSLDKVEVDPLSGLLLGGDSTVTNEFSSSGGGSGDGIRSNGSVWSNYYKSMELTNFINGDLDRLYITGVEQEEYFQTPERRRVLLSVLFIWASQHPVVSYRQGMHEIAGYVLYCVERERSAWQCAESTALEGAAFATLAEEEGEGRDGEGDSVEHGSGFPEGHTLHGAFNINPSGAAAGTGTEAHTYTLFARIMDELEPLYDPTSSSGAGRGAADHQPFVVQYCTKIQGSCSPLTPLLYPWVGNCMRCRVGYYC